MNSVIILGSGNLATHLTKAFLKSKFVDLTQVYSRNIENITYLKDKTSITDNLNSLKEADIYIISISDDAISGFSKKLSLKGKLVVHTSGSVNMTALNGDFNKGVFYPLQTFTKGKKVKFKNIPICIETEDNSQLLKLEKLASAISKNVYIIDSKQREKLHLSAVFVNNFTNHLYSISDDICKENKVPFEILLPLIKETAKKVSAMYPSESQTGPAKRNDTKTIEHQLKQLSDNQKEIYTVLTKSIIKKYN
jgi:predicted short-subunit dehydrogenase-like oxidoreductase (DUF2520 family)